MERLLHDPLPRSQELFLAGDLRADAAFDEAEGVHVLQLGLRAELAGAGRAQRDVRVAAQRALLHVHVADAELAQRRAQQAQPLAGLLGRAQIGLGDDLRERRAAAVEVDDALVRALDPAARADVDQLGRVLLQVHPVDAHLARAARRCTAARRTGRSGSPSAGRDRSSSCGGRSSAARAPTRAPSRSSGRSARRARSPPAGSPAGRGRPGRCACWADRRTTARSRRTSSCGSSAGRGSPGRSRARRRSSLTPSRRSRAARARTRRSRAPARARGRRRAAGSR